ncbi:MAG: 4-hydroxy-3-methylbut-2-enyl diphosphate reductase, partial [Ruminococcaceae bacterium]|nr:4-hydroxy-3-methylbut-2-enyl diphosphate reductase [Oscillospiraceae bacterium]
MRTILAKTAGFCFGVDRAVKTVEKLVDEGRRVCTLGPIIHNPQVISDFERRGVTIVRSPAEAEQDRVLVIRSHGVAASIYDELKARGIEYVDATCPFVAKIHSIVSKASAEGRVVLIAGDASHPEVLGISGHCSGEYHVFGSAQELDDLVKSNIFSEEMPITVVAQTTFDTNSWEICSEIIKKVFTNAIIFDTICNATQNRQSEARELAAQCDLMLVIGGRNSSNTQKLLSICSEHGRACLIETAAELPADEVRGAHDIGITAGASTPAGIIKEVLESMSEIYSNDENFAALLEESFKNSNTNGKVVEGTVVG